MLREWTPLYSKIELFIEQALLAMLVHSDRQDLEKCLGDQSLSLFLLIYDSNFALIFFPMLYLCYIEGFWGFGVLGFWGRVRVRTSGCKGQSHILSGLGSGRWLEG